MPLRAVLPRVALLLLLAAAAVPAGGADDDVPTRIPFPDPVPDETNTYGLYVGRDKVGWAELALRRETVEGVDCYVSEARFQAEVATALLAGSVDFASRDVFEAAPPYLLLEGRERLADGAGVRETVLRREGDAWVGTTARDGAEEPARLVAPTYTLVDRLTHIQWLRTSPTPGQSIRVRELDLARLVPDVYGYRVLGTAPVGAASLPFAATVVALTSAQRGSLGEAWMDPVGRVLRAPIGDRLEMRLEYPRQARERGWASDLAAFGRAPSAQALGEPRDVTRLVLAAYGHGAADLPAGPRRTAAWNAEAKEALLVSVAAGAGAACGEAERRAASTPDDVPGLAALARRAVGDATGPRSAVERLLAFTPAFLAPAWTPHEPPVSELLLEPWGDASEHARLFVALARSVGIPARMVRGLVYLGDAQQAFGAHAWAEVVLDDRWIEVDPAWGQSRVDATHLDLARGDADPTSLLAATRHLAFEVREVERRGRDE